MSEALSNAFEQALAEVRDGVIERYDARSTQFAVDPGELFSDVDWIKALVNSGVPENVALNIITEATSTFGFDAILEAGFTDIEITITLEGPDIDVITKGLKPNFSQVVQEHVDSLGSYSNTIKKTVQSTVDLGIKNGSSVDDISKSLFESSKFSKVSADSFAQTETVAATNGTAYAGYPDDMYKEWLHSHDSRVRQTHETAGQQTAVPMKGLFTVGQYQGRYPGAPELPIEERVWCRCTLIPVAALVADGSSIDSSAKKGETLSNSIRASMRSNMKKVTLTVQRSQSDEEEDTFENKGAETFDTDTAADDGPRPFDWEGVLTVEGLPSGDGRMIATEALEWRNLPVPLMLQTKTESGHKGADIAGSIVEIERVGSDIIGRGYFDSGETGQEFKRLVEEGTMAGVSVDLDLVVSEFRDRNGKTLDGMEEIIGELEDADGDPFAIVETVVQGRIMGATGTPFPAFQEAQIVSLDGEDYDALVASGATQSRTILRVSNLTTSGGTTWQIKNETKSLVASAGFPAVPTIKWFDISEDGDVEDFPPFTVYPDGRCFGVIAEYGSCHIGFGECVTVPKPWDGFSHACNKTTLTDDGLTPTAPIYLNTVHPDLAFNASDAETWYADTGAAVADVTLWDTPRGIVAAGAVRPDITDAELRTFRGSDVSPDWRQIKGQLTMVGLLGVNVSGFVVARDQVLVASAGSSAELLTRGRMVDGEMYSLVAAGVPTRPNRLEELEALYSALLHKVNEFVDTDTKEPETMAKTVLHIPKTSTHGISLKRKTFATVGTIRDWLQAALSDRFGVQSWVWVKDFDLDLGTVYFEYDDKALSQIKFTLTDDGVELDDGEPALVEVMYKPIED